MSNYRIDKFKDFLLKLSRAGWREADNVIKNNIASLDEKTFDDIFFDKNIYGEEINHTSETEEELRDETNPNEYEENRNKIEYMERTEDLKEITTDEEEFRTWDGIDEDWQEFNKKNSEKED